MHPIELLERYWNHTSFRPLQEEIITAVIKKNDVFVLLPTGGGKSLCFQIPALINDGICVVISPLIALMKDQVNTLKQKGIKSIALTSGISYAELDTLLDNCIYGNYKFLYLSPERLQQTIVQERIQQMNVSLIAVDEAHCISQWGNDFRPAYAQIGQLRQWHPHANVIALTATAKTEVIEDTIKALDLIDPKIFKGSFYRENVCFSVIQTNDKLFYLENLLKKHKGSSIIYVRNRRGTDDLQRFLSNKGFSVAAYHGGITNKEKQDRLNDWLNERVSIMVATTAFGMGIDKANVATVIHYHLPESLESYYQEAGRAGRNGQDAHAIILTKKTDEDQLKQQFLGSLPSVADLKLIYKKLCNYFQISYGEGHQTIHQFNFKDFCKTYKLPASKTYNGLLVLDRNSIISLDQRFSYKTAIQFIRNNDDVFQYIDKHAKSTVVIKSLLRTYGGIFDFLTKVNLDLVASKANMDEKTLITHLKTLHRDGLINFELKNTDAEITFLKPREDDHTINPIATILEQQNQLKHDQANAVLAYIHNTFQCRSQQILAYFGETLEQPCGKCSVCVKEISQKLTTDLSNIQQQIIDLLRDKSLTSRQLVQALNFTESEVILCITQLLETEQIILTSTNSYQLK